MSNEEGVANLIFTGLGQLREARRPGHVRAREGVGPGGSGDAGTSWAGGRTGSAGTSMACFGASCCCGVCARLCSARKRSKAVTSTLELASAFGGASSVFLDGAGFSGGEDAGGVC